MTQVMVYNQRRKRAYWLVEYRRNTNLNLLWTSVCGLGVQSLWTGCSTIQYNGLQLATHLQSIYSRKIHFGYSCQSYKSHTRPCVIISSNWQRVATSKKKPFRNCCFPFLYVDICCGTVDIYYFNQSKLMQVFEHTF